MGKFYKITAEKTVNSKDEKSNFINFFDEYNRNYYGKVDGKVGYVENFFVDHSVIEMEMKINNIIKGKSVVFFSMNTYQLSQLMFLISEQYYNNIEDNPVIQKICRGLFQYTKYYFKF